MGKHKFSVGTPVKVARGPFKGKTGDVLEMCDDVDFLIVDFGVVKVKILASILVPNDPQPPKPTAKLKPVKVKATSTLLRNSHRGRGKS